MQFVYMATNLSYTSLTSDKIKYVIYQACWSVPNTDFYARGNFMESSLRRHRALSCSRLYRRYEECY